MYRFGVHEIGLAERCYSWIAYPLLRCKQTIIQPCIDYYNNCRTITQLRNELEHIKEENSTLRGNIVELTAQLLYAADIAELADYKKQFNQGLGHIVQVIDRNLSEREHYILVDAGSCHGITSDMVAIHKNFLVGKVSEVFPLYSKILLITDTSCKVAAYCSKTRASGIHVGSHDELTMLQRVNHLSTVEIGDLVLSSGEGLIFPSGFGLGYVETVKSDGLYQLVSVKPLIDGAKLTHCILIQKGHATSVTMSS